MNGAELVQLAEAARVFGIPQDALSDRLTNGTIPEAVHLDGDWSLPVDALARIAEREGWSFDLTGRRAGATAMPEHINRYVSETLAAHAAVVLAKTQATAARAQAQESAQQLAEISQGLDAERAERERAANALTEAERSRIKLDQDRAVAEARADEVRRQLDVERSQRSELAQRIGMLERERDELVAALGWRGRKRLQRRSNDSEEHQTPVRSR